MIALILLLAANPFFWRANTEVKVYFIGFSESQKLAAMKGAESWQGIGARFTMASDVTEIQTCDDCLTIRRAKARKGERATQQAVYFTDSGFIRYAWIDTEAKDENALRSIMAHEVGHSLGLIDCDCDSVMGKLGGYRGWPLPNQRDIELVRGYYAGLK